jgi:hypothetical protein
LTKSLAALLLASFAAAAPRDARAAESAPGADTASDVHETWNHIELVDRYSFRGAVLENEDLSGIAAVSRTRCLVGADEGLMVQIVGLSRESKELTVLQSVPLLTSGKEIDIEAIAAAEDCYYIIGSHGLTKKKGDYRKNRYKLFRLPVNPDTGFPVRGLRAASLSSLVRSDLRLRPYFMKPLQRSGINLEGLAFRGGRLFVGFRNPNLGGCAFVMEVDAADVFSSAENPSVRFHALPLGEGYGIREIVATDSGFLIVAGNAGSEPSDKFPESQDYEEDRGYVMFTWNGKDPQARHIGPIPHTAGKAEGMLVLDESDRDITVLMLFDGPPNGAPTVYRIF